MQNANMQYFLRPANFSRDLQLAAPGTTIFLHMQTTKVAAGFSLLALPTLTTLEYEICKYV